jgi:hypothetical protein
MWWLYVGASNDDRYAADLERMDDRSMRGMAVVASVKQVLSAVRLLTDPFCAGLVVPDDVQVHNKLIEKVKACAHQLELPVMPVTRFLNETKPATASAVPANQHHAVVG